MKINLFIKIHIISKQDIHQSNDITSNFSVNIVIVIYTHLIIIVSAEYIFSSRVKLTLWLGKGTARNYHKDLDVLPRSDLLH